jgi:hypothetical protein
MMAASTSLAEKALGDVAERMALFISSVQAVQNHSSSTLLDAGLLHWEHCMCGAKEERIENPLQGVLAAAVSAGDAESSRARRHWSRRAGNAAAGGATRAAAGCKVGRRRSDAEDSEGFRGRLHFLEDGRCMLSGRDPGEIAIWFGLSQSWACKFNGRRSI